MGEIMARGKAPSDDVTTLQMALVGYQLERQKIDDKIREIEALLGGKKVPKPASAISVPANAGAAPRKRNLSAAARKRIAMAQKRRWAEHRRKAAQGKAPGAKSAPKAEAKSE